jgi:hypothetical protein
MICISKICWIIVNAFLSIYNDLFPKILIITDIQISFPFQHEQLSCCPLWLLSLTWFLLNSKLAVLIFWLISSLIIWYLMLIYQMPFLWFIHQIWLSQGKRYSIDYSNFNLPADSPPSGCSNRLCCRLVRELHSHLTAPAPHWSNRMHH